MPSRLATSTNMNSENTQREELHALRAGGVAQHVGDELVGHFGDRLQARRDQARGSTCVKIQERAGGDRRSRP